MKQQNLPTLSMPLNGLTLLGIWMVATVPPPTFGQVPTGRIEGTLQDSSGAVIPVAQLSLVNERTQTRLFAESGSEGFSSLGIPCGSLRNGIG